jgi:hypothetical protein
MPVGCIASGPGLYHNRNGRIIDEFACSNQREHKVIVPCRQSIFLSAGLHFAKAFVISGSGTHLCNHMHYQRDGLELSGQLRAATHGSWHIPQQQVTTSSSLAEA